MIRPPVSSLVVGVLMLAPAVLASQIEMGAAANGGGMARDVVIATCEANGWHAGRSAAALGVARTTLYYWLRTRGVSLRELKKNAGCTGRAPRRTPRLDVVRTSP